MDQRKQNYFLIISGILSFVIFVAYSFSKGGHLGFPLDDGWIHQTYARNFADFGEWSYVPGNISGGSTSPLWTLILSITHLIKTGPFWGTFLISMVFFVLAGITFQRLAVSSEINSDDQKWKNELPIFGLFFLLEWHMNWAAVSGMEIIFYIAMILFFFSSLLRGSKPGLSGLLVGLAFWIRPDGLTLLGPLIAVFILNEGSRKKKFQDILKASFVFLPFLLLYFGFNQLTAGTWWPNTFYAKQTEYAILYQISLSQRFLQLFSQPWVSGAVSFLPGFVFILYSAIRDRNWKIISMALWAVGYIFIYAVRLPVIYQHARYLMPTMPIIYCLGMVGTLQLIGKLKVKPSVEELVKFGTYSLITLLTIGFYILGIKAYSTDVAIIHEEMVETSIWIRDHVSDNEVIAAHDIGALGYYGEHDLLDLAGLISPEVIPFLRDEERLLDYLKENDVQYLMSLSDWYTILFSQGTEIYRSKGSAVIDSGGQPMVVFRYDWEGE